MLGMIMCLDALKLLIFKEHDFISKYLHKILCVQDLGCR